MAVFRTESLGWASSGVRVLSGESEITQLKISFLKGNGSFELDGGSFTVDSHGLFRADATLKKGGTVIARVKHKGFPRGRFEISSAGHKLVLKTRGWTGRSYVLQLMGQEVGRITRAGLMGTKITSEFPDEVPVFLQVLMIYIALAHARRQGAAAAASS